MVCIEGGQATAAGGGLQLDDEWVVDHAVMLERLLPGGAPGAAPAASTASLAWLYSTPAKLDWSQCGIQHSWLHTTCLNFYFSKVKQRAVQ